MRPYSIPAEKFFDRAHKVASLYGFSPVNEAIKQRRHTKKIKISPYNRPTEKHLQHLSRLLRFYFEQSLHLGERTPLFLFHSNIDQKTKPVITASKKPDSTYFTLTVLGIEDPYAEALLLACTSHIFRVCKSKNYRIRINSMGTSDDSKNYFSKLSKTLKKVKRNIHPECKKLLDEGKICEAHTLLYSNDHHSNVAEYITPTLRLLSEKARQHFEHVIEYLEANHLDYELAPDIVELTQHGAHTTFEVHDEELSLHARGARYDQLPGYTYRRRTPATSITINLPEEVRGNYQTKVRPAAPKIFFFHVGEKARLQSLRVISKLYDARIPVAHRLHHRRVADQLDRESRQYPYRIIFGQEEVENNVICLRNAETNASRIISLNDEEMQAIKTFIRER